MNTAYVWLLLLICLVACRGPMGPTGLPGPQGRVGLTGERGAMGPAGVTTLWATAVANQFGAAEFALPTTLDPSKPPVMTCYQTAPGSTVWLTVAGDLMQGTSTFCAAAYLDGHWTLIMDRMTPGWIAGWSVAY